jgi:hypothetical protein
MNVMPQSYIELVISLHRTDDAIDQNCVHLKFTGDAADIGTALILGMLADRDFEDVVRAAVISMDNPDIRKVPITKLVNS